MTVKGKKRKDMNPVERSIFSRENAIARMKQNCEKIRQQADAEIAAVQKRIREKQFYLDALKKGAIQL